MRTRSEAVRFWRSRWTFGLIVGMSALIAGRPATTAIADDAPPDQPSYAPREMDDLQQLVAPIALYPDALLAQVLAATTYPDDVIAAAQWEDAGNNPQGIDAQPWDTSVKGVARYPAILHYLASHGDWMNDLGDAFLNQQGDVMTAVQNLRGQALAAGSLVSTPQQTVVNDDGYIQILPADPDTLYPPVYDPQVVYAPPPYVGGETYAPYITFGPGVVVGDWLDFDLDWHDRGIFFGHWGHDRPWWHYRDGGGIHHYNEFRPGLYRPGQFRDPGGRVINAQADHWARDNRRPAPRVTNRPAPRITGARPERGYPARAVEPGRAVVTPRGTDVVRESERGRTSRQTIKPPPARVTPEPARREPVHAVPARVTPRQVAPAPEARPSAPVRGGAMGGYQNGGAAAQSSSRGGASRGSAGGGGGGHGHR